MAWSRFPWLLWHSVNPEVSGFQSAKMGPLTEVAANFRVVDQMRKWQKLGRERNHLEWEMYASTVNAYFNPPAWVKRQWNVIYVTYIILDKRSFFLLESCDHPGTMSNGPLLQSIVALIKTAFGRPGYLNYGGMGAISAHELTVHSLPSHQNLVVWQLCI